MMLLGQYISMSIDPRGCTQDTSQSELYYMATMAAGQTGICSPFLAFGYAKASHPPLRPAGGMMSVVLQDTVGQGPT